MIAGIDLSTKAIDIVRRVDGETDAHWTRISLPKHPPKTNEADALSARALRELFPRGEFWEGVYLAGIEYPFTGGKAGFQSVGLKTMLGAVLALLPAHVHPLPMPANFWQPRFCLRGKSIGFAEAMPVKGAERKPLIAARALELLESDDIWPQDAYDAFGISWIAEQVNDAAVAAA